MLALLSTPTGLSYRRAADRERRYRPRGRRQRGARRRRSCSSGGEAWCYVQESDDVFARRRDRSRHGRSPQGYFQSVGLRRRRARRRRGRRSAARTRDRRRRRGGLKHDALARRLVRAPARRRHDPRRRVPRCVGSWQASKTPVDVFPEFVPAQVSIQAEAPGFTPDQVETLVTRPIEAAVNGAQALAALRSESIAGLSAVSTRLQARHRSAARAPGHRRAARARRGLAARRRRRAEAVAAHVEHDGRAEARPRLRQARPLRAARPRGLEPEAAAARGARRRARERVRRRRPAAARSARTSPKLEAYGITLAELADAARAALALRGAGFVDHRRRNAC